MSIINNNYRITLFILTKLKLLKLFAFLSHSISQEAIYASYTLLNYLFPTNGRNIRNIQFVLNNLHAENFLEILVVGIK